MKVALMAGVAVTAIVSMSPTGAAAQTIAPAPGSEAAATGVTPDQNAPNAKSSTGLEEIIVTAQRRSENLQRAAIAVTAISSDAIVRSGLVDATQLTKLAPALQVSNSFGPSNAFYLRGVGNFVTNTLSDPAVAFNLDGVNIARPTAAQGVFYDLDRIEVLKGPQGTLYGRNATGGAINVITTKPKFGELSGYGTAEIGNYDEKKLTAAINVPLGSKSALRIAGQVVDRDGWYSDGTGDDKNQAIRATFASQLTDNFKITVGGDFAHQGGIGTGSTVRGLNEDDRIGLFDPRAQAIIASNFSFLAGNNLNPLTKNIYNDNKYWGMYAQADWTTSIGTLTILPAHRSSHLNYRTYTSGFGITERADQDQTSVEARLASNGSGRLGYIFGVYYMNERVNEDVSYAQQYFGSYASFKPKTDSYAAFARLSFKVTDSFRLTGGIRYTTDKKSANIVAVNAVVVCPGVFVPPPAGPIFCFGGTPSLPTTLAAPSFLYTPGGVLIPVQPYGAAGAIVQASVNPIDPSRTFRKTTFRAGFEYDLAPHSLLYGSFETGFKSGGFFQSIDNPTFKPESIDAFTIGSKNRFLDNRLQLNLEVFRWTYKNQQISHFRTNSQGGTEFVTENIGKTRLQGVEIEGLARVLPETTLNATVQYLDARNTQFVYDNPAALGPPVTGCAVRGPASGLYTVDCSGRRPTQAPKWTLSGGIEQVIKLGEFGDLTLNAQTRYQSGSFTGFELLPTQYQRGYFSTDLQASLKTRAGFTFAAFVNNLENNSVVAFSTPHPRAPTLLIENLRAPRLYGLRVGFKF